MSDKCGTRIGYRRHLNRDEKACAECLRANAEYNRRYRALKRHPHSKAAGPTVIDVLSTYTEWMTIETLIGRVQFHRPDLSDENIERTTRRLMSEDRIQSRRVEGTTGDVVLVYSDEWAAWREVAS